MSPLVLRTVEYLVLPPGGPLLVLLLAILLYGWGRFLAFVLLLVGALSLYAASTPKLAHHLMARVEAGLVPLRTAPEGAQAIVVPGAGLELGGPGGDSGVQLNGFALQRLLHAARLQRETRLPILVGGGPVYPGEAQAEAALARRVLEDDFRVPVRWEEDQSRNTWENAQYAWALLQPAGVRHIILVTHAFHMPRARWCFERAGFEVTPAPIGFARRDALSTGWIAWIPQVRALVETRLALHEWLGLHWYRWRFD